MPIFRKFSLYLSLIGIFLIVVLVKKITAPLPEPEHLVEPSVNPYAHTLAASGIVESMDRNIAVGTSQSGLVTRVFVSPWDEVKKDQPLFQVDDRELQAQLLVQNAQVKVAEAQLRLVQDQLTRLRSVQDKRAVSGEELRTQENRVLIAEADLALTYAQVQQTHQLIDRLTVLAPKDGVIIQSNIRVGEHVSAIASMPAMLLSSADRLQIRADIDEQNALHVRPHLPSTAFLKNQPNRPIALRFERIEPYVIPKRSLTGGSDERVDTRVLQVLFSFDRPVEFPLYVGQQVDVFIERDETSKDRS